MSTLDCILLTIGGNLLIFWKSYFSGCSFVISLVTRFIHKILQKYKNTAKSVAQNVKSVAQTVKSVALLLNFYFLGICPFICAFRFEFCIDKFCVLILLIFI